MKQSQLITLETENGILITFDSAINCPSTYGLNDGYTIKNCKLDNCPICWEKAIEDIEDISVLIHFKKEE